MFFRAKNGTTYPVAAITKMETPYRKAGEPINGPLSDVIVHLGEEFFVLTRQLDVDRILSTPITSFPSAPGTFLISVEDDEVEKKPIIGWAVSAQDVRPIMVYGVFDDPEEEWVVLTPDGTVNDQHSNSWPNLDAYREYRQDRASR
jgi:hypothetical protein